MPDETHEPYVRVMALHALAYCERLFYLEEVEQIRLADERVYAGRRLHESLQEDGEWTKHTLESPLLGLMGKVDALRRRDGELIPYEHKRGRAHMDGDRAQCWSSDRLQIGAYAMMLEEAYSTNIPEGRVRYHANNAVVRVPIDEQLREEVRQAIQRARELRSTTVRPPIANNEKLCVRCSLAPVCLPEENRKGANSSHEPKRLFPANDDRQPLHILGHGTKVGRRGYELRIKPREGQGSESKEPIRRVRSVTLHGYSSISTQALDLCASQDVAVHWFRPGGQYIGSFCRDDVAVQRRIRQYEALRQDSIRLSLAKLLMAAKTEQQLRFVMRSSRGRDRDELGISESIEQMRTAISSISKVGSVEKLLGVEGWVARCYFKILPNLVLERISPDLRPKGRSRRPPKDPFNALLSLNVTIKYRPVMS